MKPLILFSFLSFFLFSLVGITACKTDENTFPGNEYPIPLNEDDNRYANAPTLFTLHEQEGYFKLSKDSPYTLIYPHAYFSSFREVLLPIRLPSNEIIRQALRWPEPLDDLSGLSVVFSGEVKGKEGTYYPVVLTKLRIVLDVPLSTGH